MTTDPGAVPPDAKPLLEEDSLAADEGKSANQSFLEEDVTTGTGLGDRISPVTHTRVARRMCRRCNAYKPTRAHHCSVCKRCIVKMDHHCPWVNNCVGIGNHKYFLLFVFYTCVSCMYSLCLLMCRFFGCLHAHEGGMPRTRSKAVLAAVARVAVHQSTPQCLDKPGDLLTITGLVVEAILFGLFTFCMIVDQWDVVNTNVTNIDRLKGIGGTESSSPGALFALSGWQEVFGEYKTRRWFYGRSRLVVWLSPFARVCLPHSVKNEILGYRRSCGLDNFKRAEFKMESCDNGGPQEQVSIL
eukprot:CAMPEP_0118687700 /NCGR_PEP_ID=MMETSP0800-20121206/8525_1 /TAXON_ID=210618 ORGANISM="Striatella unipunctata, Strain CCMP2910" /NCGR_SAMPLE_ID=MMETSP0800 /ASSEMBLY_ACC=CAM_ASM_000638 /LENGTH=299 /DNA_ID=CAMNT_0006584907 /DNA_START=415 /DNA_END=1314 /DNA_ORIENTATION=+